MFAVLLALLTILPEKYHRDPGAQFCAVYVSGEVDRAKLQEIADRNDWVMVRGDEREHMEVDGRYRTYRDNRMLRRGISAGELLAPDGERKLRNWFASAQFAEDAKPVVRYGAKVTKAVRGETAAPKVVLPEGWRLLEGDDGLTGCDVRDYYFTVEAFGRDLPPPRVELEWPGVAVKAAYGAKDVEIGKGRVSLVPTRRNGPPTGYITTVREGALHLAWHHHVEGCQHGPYAGKPLPWTGILASANWRAAAREAFKAAGLATFDRTDGASVNLYGFDSNFPNRHVDHPPHFHVMLEWDGFKNNNVGHYMLDSKGFIRGNDFLVCGKVPGYDRAGYRPQKPGETTAYNGPSGKAVFTLTMLSDGTGLVLRKPGCAQEWKIASAAPEKSVEAYAKDGDGWRLIASLRVEDDTVAGLLRIVRTSGEGTEVEELHYNPDTGSPVVKAL